MLPPYRVGAFYDADTDLSTLAEACRNMTLLTGGSALARPLPELYRTDGLLPADAPRLIVPALPETGVVLSGSCSAMTRAQVAVYAEQAPGYRLDPLSLAREGVGPALDWLAGQDMAARPILYATAEPEAVKAAQSELGVEAAGAVVEQALARIALDARDRGARRFVVAGGETSGAVTQALGASRLDIGKEIAPGVPWTYAESGGVSIALTLKSGNFGSKTFFADAFATLETG